MENTAGQELAIPVGLVERRIYLIRGQKVMIDSDLAELYEVLTKNLNKAVKRNRDRFPADFMFQLTEEETEELLRFQIGTSNETRGGRRYLPYAFTEHGVAMLSSVLRSERAVQMNIVIVRAFVKLREMLATHEDLARAIEDIGRRQDEQGEQITAIIETVNQFLLPEPVPTKRRIGFYAGEEPEPEGVGAVTPGRSRSGSRRWSSGPIRPTSAEPWP